jgi:hypothetical protein
MTMMTDYKATPEQEDAIARAWAFQQQWAQRGDEDSACFLELRSRIERLELGAGIRDAVAKEVRQSYPEKPSKSLAQRVAGEIALAEGGWHNEARAAIREVAAWLDTRGQHGCSLWLREELEVDHE